MSKWTESKKTELINKSISNEILSAYKEWFVTEELGINYEHKSICDLCGQNNLYWEYYIQNSKNGNKMLIGSDCIFLFYEIDEIIEFNALSNGVIKALTKSEMKIHFKAVFRNKVVKEVREKLSGALEGKGDFYKNFMPNVLNLVQEGKKLSPKQAHFLMKFIDENIESIENEKYFKRLGKAISVNLKKKTFRDQFENDIKIKLSKYKRFFLTEEQKKII